MENGCCLLHFNASSFVTVQKVERTRQLLNLKKALDKSSKRPAGPLFKSIRQNQSDMIGKVCAMWQKKDLATRTARDHVAPEQGMVKGESYIPECVEVSAPLLSSVAVSR